MILLYESTPPYITNRFAQTTNEDFSSGISYRSLRQTSYAPMCFYAYMFMLSKSLIGTKHSVWDWANLDIFVFPLPLINAGKQSVEILRGQKHLCSMSGVRINASGLIPIQLFGLLLNLSLPHCSLCSTMTLGDTQRRLIEKQS